MQQFLKYLGAFCLLTIAASLAFCSVGVYQGMRTANRLLAGADNYTCRQFVYDLQHPETDKFAPLAIATIAYGSQKENQQDHEDAVVNGGMEPAVRKVYALCKNQPAERVLNIFTATIVAPVSTTSIAETSTTLVTPTTPQPAE